MLVGTHEVGFRSVKGARRNTAEQEFRNNTNRFIGWVLHVQDVVRTFLVEDVDKVITPGLLQEVETGCCGTIPFG
jgi:hypothetical protein